VADLAYRSGLYVQATDHGGIYTSTNRLVWVRRESGTDRDLRGAAFLGERLLLTGEAGTVLWSDDGVDFEQGTLQTPTTDWLEGVAASANRAVAAGDRGAIYLTADGLTWTRVETGFTEWLSGVAHGAGTFVAVGELGLIASSSDGEVWSRRSAPVTTDLTRVAYGEGRFIATGREGIVLSSPDGVEWSRDTSIGITNDLLAGVVAPMGELVMGESALLLRDGHGPWQNQISNGPDDALAPEWTYLASVWDGERFLVSGRTGISIESLHTSLPGAPNLTLWFRHEESPRTWLWEVARIGHTYLAAGDRGTILSSASGADWSLESSGVGADTVFYGIAGSTNVALAAGTGGAIARSVRWTTNLVVTNLIIAGGRTNELVITNTLDLLGVVWDPVIHGLTTNTLQGIAWDGEQFVIVGAMGTVLRSPDGSHWELGSIGSDRFFSAVARSPSGWVAGGTGGSLFNSVDGKDWTAVASGTTQWIYRIRALPGALVAVGQGGILLVSTNGTDWSSRETGTDAWLTDVTQVGNAFYACGVQGTLVRSTNLVSWEKVGIPTGKALQGMAVCGAQLVVAGAEGIVLRTVAEPAAAPVAIAVFRHLQDVSPPVDLFLFEGAPEQRFLLDRAPALGAWETAAELRVEAGGVIALGLESGSDRRFYRVVNGGDP
jgi:hypothetical protein